MDSTVMQLENKSKKFCKSLKRSMLYGISDITRNLFGIRTRSGKLRKNEFWALDDINFQLSRGEVLGIIGSNGSGKSTLLKLLNGIFWPDKGRIALRGRVGALIEVGAGFHPLLTGRENIYLNGAILGMKKKEVEKKFDEIVDFAGIGDFLDTPVKHYSSGMFVRLGFSVAAHCDPDILLIDEILAVGDLNFQLKCRKKIREMRQKETAIVMVSHNMHTVNYLCRESILIHRGKKVFHGDTGRAIDIYRESQTGNSIFEKKDIENEEFRITGFSMINKKSGKGDRFNTGDPVKFKVSVYFERELKDYIINLSIYDEYGNVVTGIRNDQDRIKPAGLTGGGEIELDIDQLNLLPGFYTINANIIDSDGFTFHDRVEGIGQFQVGGGKEVNGVAYFPHKWTFKSTGDTNRK